MELNANRHSDAEQERPHEDVGVQRQASLFFYGEGGSEKPPLPADILVRALVVRYHEAFRGRGR